MGLKNRAQQFGTVLSIQAITFTTTAQSITVPAGAVSALITVGAVTVRYRSDGTSPTTSVGHFIAANGNIEIFGDEMSSIELIATATTSVSFITYYEE